MRQAVKDEIARNRAERDKFKRYASEKRKLAQQLRKKRDWLAALEADSRAGEYRRSAAQRHAHVLELMGKIPNPS